MTTTRCPHHWIIETSAGSTSKGVCKLCGEERDFDNSPDEVNRWTMIANKKRLEQNARGSLEAHTEEQP